MSLSQDASQLSLEFRKKRDALQSRLIEKSYPEGLRLKAISREELMQIVKENYARVFDEAPPARFQTPDSRKPNEALVMAQYTQALHHERFAVIDSAGKVVGWFMGESEDHVTFYLRNAGLVPEYRQKGVLRAFLPVLLEYLTGLGYERVTSQHQATNAPVLIAMLKSGFYIEGLNLDERWGPLVKMVKHLHGDRAEDFRKQFARV